MMRRLHRLALLCAGSAVLAGPSLSMAQGRPPGTLDAEATRVLLARAKALELPTPHVPPPGDPRSHAAAGWAKTTCSAIFVTGLTQAEAIDAMGLPTASLEERNLLERPVIDRQRREVRVAVPGGAPRIARYTGGQGCVALPPQGQLFFQPRAVPVRRSAAGKIGWPTGDRAARGTGTGIHADLVKQAADAAFADPAARTSAFIVTHKGRIVAERYATGIGPATPLESWSMGKSIAAALMGVLIERGVYRLDQPAPIPQWQGKDDPRGAIRIRDLLNMSSGLRAMSGSDPDDAPGGAYPDHQYLYTGTDDAVRFAATRPLQWPPGQVGRYRNTDPVLIGGLIRMAAEKQGIDPLIFPQWALFDRIGIQSAVLETDPHGNHLLQGYVLMAARDWARLANLFLQEGFWQGKRILPRDFVRFVQTPAPAWVADGRPMYGGFFVLNTSGSLPVPTDAYFMSGAGGQFVIIIPSWDMTVVRIGQSSGQAAAGKSFSAALRQLKMAMRDIAP